MDDLVALDGCQWPIL